MYTKTFFLYSCYVLSRFFAYSNMCQFSCKILGNAFFVRNSQSRPQVSGCIGPRRWSRQDVWPRKNSNNTTGHAVVSCFTCIWGRCIMHVHPYRSRPIACRVLTSLTLSPPIKLSSFTFFVCFNFQSASMSLKVGENVVWASNSLDPGETPDNSASHPDPSCLHMTLSL